MSLCRLWIVIGVVICLSASVVYGEIYKWVDKNGKVHFGDEKPEKIQTEQVDIQVNSFESLRISDSDFLSAREQRSNAKESWQVVMYSATWCGYCRKARSYFKQKSIPFKEYDIENSRKGRRDYVKLNGTGVPIIFVGKKRMQGFRAARFQALYDQAYRTEGKK